MTKKKLSLNKERIVKLTREQASEITGGKAASASSSNHNFTCCWCTGGGEM